MAPETVPNKAVEGGAPSSVSTNTTIPPTTNVRPALYPSDSAPLFLKHKRRFCSIEGCGRIVKSQGLCQRHGAKPRTCKVEGCTKQAQGNFDKMCKAHFKAMKRRTTPIPKVEFTDVPPPAEGFSVYDAILPQSIAFSATKAAAGAAMPLIAHLKHGFDTLKPPAWHRNEERRARGLVPIDNPAAQLEGWERELVWMEILVLTGAPGASFRQLARAWGRDKGFHMVLAQFICERHGDVERKKRHGENGADSAIQRPAVKKRKSSRGDKAMPANVGAHVWDPSVYGTPDTNEALAADIFGFSEMEFRRGTSKYKRNGKAGIYAESEAASPTPSVAEQAAMASMLGDDDMGALPRQPTLPLRPNLGKKGTNTAENIAQQRPQSSQSEKIGQHGDEPHHQYENDFSPRASLPMTTTVAGHDDNTHAPAPVLDVPVQSVTYVQQLPLHYPMSYDDNVHTLSHLERNVEAFNIPQRAAPPSTPPIMPLADDGHIPDHHQPQQQLQGHDYGKQPQNDGNQLQASVPQMAYQHHQHDYDQTYQHQQENNHRQQQLQPKEVIGYEQQIPHPDYHHHGVAQQQALLPQVELYQHQQHNGRTEQQPVPPELLQQQHDANQRQHLVSYTEYQFHDGAQQQPPLTQVNSQQPLGHHHVQPQHGHHEETNRLQQFVANIPCHDHQATQQEASTPHDDFQQRQRAPSHEQHAVLMHDADGGDDLK